LGKRRYATGYFGRRNGGWRELYDGFVPDGRIAKLLRRGLSRWLRAELTNIRLMFVPRKAASATPARSPAAAEA
jgi:hypothetical protein